MRIFTLIAFLALAYVAEAFEVSSRLLDAMELVESNGNPTAVGDNGRAIGCLQLHKCYVDEASRLGGTKYSYNDRLDRTLSRRMAAAYLRHWGTIYERETGKPATDEVLAKIHNGHTWWRKGGNVQANVCSYWLKVKARLR